MIWAALSALMSHWRRQPLQLITLIAGLALATGLWSAVQAINAEARASYASALSQFGADQGPVLVARDGLIPLDRYVALRRAGWQVSPVLQGRLKLKDKTVTLIGVDFLSSPKLPQTSKTTGSIYETLVAPGRLFASADTAKALSDQPGLPPVTVVDTLPTNVVLTDIGIAETLLDQPGLINHLLILNDQPGNLPTLSEIAPDLERQDPATARLTDSFHLNLTAFGLLAFAVGLFIVHGTVGLAFEQRRAMFRTLRALGLPSRNLTVLVLGELTALALIAGTLGLVIGYLIAAALLPDVSATLRGLYGASIPGELILRPTWIFAGLGMAVSGALLAGAHGVWKLAHMPILSASGSYAWSQSAASAARWQAWAGLALLAGGIATVVLFDGLIAGFVLLGGLMLGAALMLPRMLGLLLSLAGSRARGPVAQWVWADMQAQLPGISLALMALLLALATNVGVGTMVSSFRLTFTGWLDQRLAAELYLTARNDTQGAQLQDWLNTRVDAVLPIRYTEAKVHGQSTRVYGIVDHQTYRDNWPLLSAEPKVWSSVFTGTGALISEQMARRDDLNLGDTVAFGPDWQLSIVGIYSDYGNPNGQAIVSMETLWDHTDHLPNRQFGVRMPPDKVANLIRDLNAQFDPPLASIVNQSDIKARSLAIFEKTFVVTGALNILTLGVASFAILTSLLTLWSMRLPQLAPVWALGLTRKHLARLEMARSLALAVITALLALPLGLALAWVLLTVINVEAFGWRLPMYLFPFDWLILFALAILAAGLAAALPALRLRRTPPADLLKVFANER
ncbi:MAG: putative ABC transport system permease protein [Paracoccaceae bacterium]